nr:hypothetical protein [Saprospiraceae bacterium]
MSQFIQILYRGSKVLFYTGLFHFILALLFLIFMGIDSRMINQESIWLKPFRFAISIFLFTWTFAWFTHFIQKNKTTIAVLNILIALCMWIEILLISMQSFRGVGSHFNVETPFDGTVFSIMGAVIGFNAVVVGIWFVLFVFFDSGGGKYRTSIIWGLFLFLLGNLSGYLIIRYGWALPATEMADKLAVVGWKSGLRDLRIPHAIGLHAIQVLPLTMWGIFKLKLNAKFIHGVGILYLSAYLFSLLMALELY